MAGDVTNRDSKRRRNDDVSTAETTSTAMISDNLNLLKGHPNPALLPVRALEKATQAVLSDHATAVKGLLYGPDPGFEPLRENIAAWLNDFYKPDVPTSSERICITGGASQNLGLMLGAYTDPECTRNIWIVAPAYFLSFRIFEDAGFAHKMRAVPEDEEGLDIEFLKNAITKSEQAFNSASNETAPTYKLKREWAKVYKHVIYCVPSYANPSSRNMSLRRRQDLVKLAHQTDALVISDDVYDFLRWPADVRHTTSTDEGPLPRLVDVQAQLGIREDDFGHVVSNGSFSKIAGPGLRTGWIDATKKFAYGVSQAGIQKSGGAPSQLTSTYVSHILETGQLQQHIRNILIPAYSSRYAKIMKAVQDVLLPLGFTLPQSDRNVVGGYFVWLGLPVGITGDQLAAACLEMENVVIIAGSKFEVPHEDNPIRFPTSIRLCIAWEEEDRLNEAVVRVGRCAQRLLDRQYVMINKGQSLQVK